MDHHILSVSSPPRVRALVFDMGDVLYDASMWRRWLFQLLARHGLRSNFQAFYAVWEYDYLPQINTGAEDYWVAMRRFLLAAGLPSGSCEEIIAAGLAKRRRFQQTIRPLTGVQNALAALATQGFQLAAVSNTPETGEELFDKLQRLNIDRYFSTCVSSLDVGHSMPHGAVYTRALNSLQCIPADAAFVGHTPFELAGATAIGMHTLSVNCPPEISATWRLETFGQIVDLPAPDKQPVHNNIRHAA